MMEDIYTTDIENLHKLASSEIIVSFCYGKSSKHGICWSVMALNIKTRAEFAKPLIGNSLHHCIEIAWLECQKQGLLKEL